MSRHVFAVVAAGLLVGGVEMNAVVAREPIQPTAAASRTAIRDELVDMAKQDQAIRASINAARRGKGLFVADASPELMKQLQELSVLDRRNTARLGEILDSQGWPSRDWAGVEGSRAAWLLLQHASAETQLRYQALVEKAVAAGDISKSDFAMMQDRILVSQNKPQRYGTQVVSNPGEAPHLADVEDIEHLDERRKSVGLPSLEDQLRKYESELGVTIDRKGLASVPQGK